jgi:hypothetical protein
MIASVSTLITRSGAATPSRTVNFSIVGNSGVGVVMNARRGAVKTPGI